MNNGTFRYFAVRVSALLTTALLIVVILETTLQIAAFASPRMRVFLFPYRVPQPTRSDPELGLDTVHPQDREHDQDGFRNRSKVEIVEIVTIGDSHTYGVSVDFDHTWPRLLENMTSCRVYNMGLSGIGPLQYEVLARRAIRFKPRQFVIGIYFGNDFYDNWQMYLRNPGKYDVPEALLTPALQRERTSALSGEVVDFFPVNREENTLGLRALIRRRSALWGAARAVWRRLRPQPSVLRGDFRSAAAALTPKQLDYVSMFEGADWKTIFVSRYRYVGENHQDPRIQLGFWLTLSAAERIDELAKQNGITALFVLLPTKESVFVEKVKNTREHQLFQELTTDEDRFRHELIQFFEEQHLAYVDMAPKLRALSQQPYFESAEGHPNELGHQTIASALRERLAACKQ